MNKMRWNEVSFSLTDLAVIGLIRFVSGFGLGLLLADSIGARNQKRVGWSLFLGSIAVGTPIGIRMLRGEKESEYYDVAQQNGREEPADKQVVF